MNEPIIISIIYYCTFIIYILSSIYIISLNYKASINRVFFLLLISLSIWSFSISISTSATDYESALLWRQISTLGWGTLYSLLLHFLILLINTDETQNLNVKPNKRLLFFLYLPAIINLMLYWIIKPIANNEFHLVQTFYGWTNINLSTSFSWFFYLYYFINVGLTIGLLILWRRKSKSNTHKRIAILILASFIFSIIIGTIIDLIIGAIFKTNILQLGPIISLIPLTTVYITTKKFNFIKKIVSFSIPNTNDILTEEAKNGVILYLSLLIFLGSLSAFIFNYFLYQENLFQSIYFSIGLSLMALILYILPLTSFSSKVKEIILIVNLAIFIPFILIRYALIDGAVTIWVLPVFVILLSVLLSTNLTIYISSFISLITLIYIWFAHPITYKVLTGEEHFLRIFILILFTWFAIFIRRLYLRRLKQSEQQIKYQQLIAKVSSDVLTINKDNIREKLADTLAVLGDYTGFDRIYCIQINKDMKTNRYAIEWYNPDTAKPSSYKELERFSWLEKEFKSKNSISISNLLDLPSEAVVETAFFHKQKTQSTVLFPIYIGDEILGIIGFDTIAYSRKITENELEQYRVITNILSDSFQKTLSEIEIHSLAYYDTLTGLPNRLLLRKELEIEIELAELRKTQLAVLFIDLDAFKLVNDSIGHSGGDLLLQMVSERISNCIEKEDTLCRFSGDEFIIIQPNTITFEDAIVLAEKIITALQNRFKINNNTFTVTSSIGIALYPQDGKTVDTLIKNADFSMYQAKLLGKNQYNLCTHEIKNNVEYRNKLILFLQKAIENNEFYIHYQPQVNILSGEISGYEALLRWTNPEIGDIPPSVFIPIAEQSGLIKSIGEWVFTSVCQQYQEWNGKKIALVPVAINLSSQQFKAEELIPFINQTIKETNMNPHLLEIEITESVAVRDTAETILILNKLKKLGIAIAIDDFGTEYSSLSRLKELPIDRVKIAMNFIHGINVDPKDEAVVNVIIYLSEKLGLRVIAEGVETKEQMEYLKKENCTDIQGYYYYRPMTAKALEKLYEDNN